MKRTYLVLLWHMHQPFYKELAENLYTMPWVRLHTLKDYFGMVAMLKEFPSIHVTFNLVPCLIAQIADYALETARERAYEIAFEPADKLDAEERQSLLAFALQLNREDLLNRYPRLRELAGRVRGNSDPGNLARHLTTQDILDLQVLSQLAWFDEIILAGDPEVNALVRKEQGYTEQDKSLVYRKEVEICKVTLEEYRKGSERGQIEISTSPFYHPILPLLCDSRVAEESHPGVKLPLRHFLHPEDAQAQLRSGLELHERVFGRRPRGLWPSEGSVSDEVLRLAAAEGFDWAATDEGVLARSLQMGFNRQPDGTVVGGQELYRPHRFVAGDDEISIFFRDHQLSDLIGFVYSRMDPHAAANDLHQRIRAAARSTGDRPAVISIILDGENAWEFFSGNGREFLKSFYRRIADDPEIRAVTASDALDVTEAGKLTHVVPGSWINANFDVWIGAEEDNRSWDLLAEAHDYFTENQAQAGLNPEEVKLAREELSIAEGSDWCWWYGPEHSSVHDEEFDLLFRKHLSNVYRLLGGSPPDDLAVPIKRPRARAVHVPPTGSITPRIDGQVTNYFEWLGSGVYSPDYHSGSMHAGGPHVEALHYGCSDRTLYLRIDLGAEFLEEHPEFEVRVNIDGKGGARLHASIAHGKVSEVLFGRGEDPVMSPLAPGPEAQVAFGRICEVGLDFSLLGLHAHEKSHIQVSLWAKDLPLQVIPQEGWLALELTDELMSW